MLRMEAGCSSWEVRKMFHKPFQHGWLTEKETGCPQVTDELAPQPSFGAFIEKTLPPGSALVSKHPAIIMQKARCVRVTTMC